MKTLSLIYHFSADTDTDWLLTQLVDFSLFGKHHPFITSVELLPAIAADGEGTKRYFVREKIKLFGFIPQRPTYEVLVLTNETEIIYTARIKNALDLAINWQINTNADKSITLQETINLQGNSFLAWFFMRILHKAHLATMANMQKGAKTK
jgi:hypothetical protein